MFTFVKILKSSVNPTSVPGSSQMAVDEDPGKIHFTKVGVNAFPTNARRFSKRQ